MNKQLKKKQMYSTGALMKDVFKCLGCDFRANGLPASCIPTENDVNARKFVYPDKFEAPPFLFKMQYQLESLWKRFRFDPDIMSEDEVLETTVQKFRETQLRIGKMSIDSLPLRTKLVVQRARGIIKEALGSFSEVELIEACKFGTKSTFGVPYRESYLDSKLGLPLSGSTEQIEWFLTVLAEDKILGRAIKDAALKVSGVSTLNTALCTHLQTSFAEKSFKAKRMIMPNSTIGNYRSYGLGKLIEEALKRVLIFLSSGKQKHQMLARESSITRKMVTADLTSASDSYWCALINALLPREWYRQLKLGRISRCDIRGSREYLSSFMTMGIGFTFPLQTLCFYALIKAVISLLQGKGHVSVFGDDLIYPRKYHRYVKETFETLGFSFNREKTYVSTFFRESCGGDFFRGHDVRPFQPEGSDTYLSRLNYLCFLYKTLNGLRRRWEISEIPQTYHFLLREILRVDRTVLLVPPLFPDHTGFKVEEFELTRLLPWYIPVEKVRAKWGRYQAYDFKYLQLTPQKRTVKSQYVYYWDTLRADFIGEWDDPFELLELTRNKQLYKLRDILRAEHWLTQIPEGRSLNWDKIPFRRKDGKWLNKMVRGGLNPKITYPKLRATVTHKSEPLLIGYAHGSTSSWANAVLTD